MSMRRPGPMEEPIELTTRQRRSSYRIGIDRVPDHKKIPEDKMAGSQTAAPKKKSSAKAAGKSDAEKKPRKTPNALQQPLTPSAELAAVVGEGPLPRAEVVSKVWSY